MKLNSSSFVLSAVLGAAMAVSAFADGDYGYRCSSYSSEYNPQQYTYVCSIAQGESFFDNNSGYSTLTHWAGTDGLQKAFNEALSTAVSNCRNEYGSFCQGVEIRFETDIDLGGFQVVDGDTVCVNEFAPIYVPFDPSATQIPIVVNGLNSTIRGFCNISNVSLEQLSFFQGYGDYASNQQPRAGALEVEQIKDLSFDGVYLKAARLGSIVGVFAALSSGVDYSNIHVMDAKVIAGNVAGGIIGVDTVSVNTSLAVQTNSSFSIKNSYVEAEIDAPTAGGLVGRTGVSQAEITFESNSVTARFKENESGMFVGGLVGMAVNMSTGNVVIRSLENRVMFEFEGLASNENSLNVGGAVGSLMDIDSFLAERNYFDVRISAANDQKQRLGGIVGLAQMKSNGGISTEKNRVDGTIVSTGTGNRDRLMGGILGIGSFKDGGLSSNQDSLAISLKGSSEGNIYAGGIVGNLDITSTSPELGKVAITSALVRDFGGEDLISISSSKVNSLYAGGLVGYVSAPGTISEVSKSRVEGDIRITTEGFDGVGAVGGLVGKSSSMTLLAYENVNAGNILADIDTVGYAIGSAVSDAASSEGTFVYANLHYGKGDADVASPLGALILGSTPVTSWDHGSYFSGDYNYNVSHNYRNAIETGSSQLSPTGKLKVTGTGAIVVDEDSVQNGVISESEMKSRLMTYVMNQDKPYPVTEDLRTSCWESEIGTVPHVCLAYDEHRTVYQVKIDISRFYSRLSEDDKSLLEPYLYEISLPTTNMGDDLKEQILIAYTESNGQVNKEFAQRVKALASGVSYGIVDGTTAVDLETVKLYGDFSYETSEDRRFDIVYEFLDPTDGTIRSLDADEFSTIYLWPKVTQVSRFGDKSVVPPVFMMLNDVQTEVYASRVTVTCDENDDNYEICQMQEQYPFTTEGKLFTFSEAIGELYAGNNNMVGISDTLHVVYTTGNEEVVPQMSIANSDERFDMTLKGYGYKNGELYSNEEMVVSTNSESATKPMYSRFSAEVERGFIFKKWKVDLWFMGGNLSSAIEACYYRGFTMGECMDETVYETTEAYFAGANEIISAFSTASPNKMAQVISTEIDGDEMLNMDSLAVAIPEISGRLPRIHMQVTPEVEAIPYTIDFDVNTDDRPVFIAGYTDSLVVYSRENGETAAFPLLFSTKACFMGWATEPKSSDGFLSLSKDLMEQIDVTDNSFSLYGIWGTEGGDQCEEMPELKPLALQYEGGSDLGEIYLWQRLVNPSGDSLLFKHEFDGKSVDLPSVEASDFLFHVGVNAKPGYALDSLTLSWTDPYDEEVREEHIDISDPIIMWSDYIGMDPVLIAKFVEAVNVDLVLNKNKDDVFYDLAFTYGEPLEVRNSGAQVELPSVIYTADACVAGWSFYADADTVDVYVMSYGERLYKNLYETQKLYAVWYNAQQCIDSMGYAPVTAKAEKGNIELVEITPDGTKRTHRFGADGSMILPDYGRRGEIRVYAVPDRGYVLDSIVMVQDDKSETISDGTLIDFGSDGIELYAYFSESSEPVDGDGPALVQSGNAVQFSFPGAHFVRNSDAWVNIVLENDDGDTLKDTTFDCNSYGCYIWWNKYPLKAGNYLFAARMFDGLDTTWFERDFEVANEIAKGKSWHMVALSDVDMDDMEWKGREKIYWWNESANYGKYWQYQEFTKKSSAQQGVGYWYHSLDGKPLKLNEDAYVDEMEWSLDSVNSGWNMVANPYGWYIDLGVEYVDTAKVLKWAEEEKENDKNVDLEWLESEVEMMLAQPAVEFWRWNEMKGAYEPADTLRPYEAVWAKVNDVEQNHWELSNTPVYVDTLGLDDDEGERKSLNKAVVKTVSGKSGWTLQAILSDANGKMDSWNTLGAGLRTWASEEPPAGMGDRVNLSIVEGGKRLAKSVKAAGEGNAFEWNVELSATSARKGYLEIAGVDALLERGLHVFVTIDGKTREVHSGEKLAVDLSTTAKTANIFVAPTAKRSVASELRGLRAVQSGNALQVSFDASGMDGAKARVDVFDMKGSVVASASQRCVDGINAFSLEMPRRGLYTVRVAVAGSVATRRILLR